MSHKMWLVFSSVLVLVASRNRNDLTGNACITATDKSFKLKKAIHLFNFLVFYNVFVSE